MYPKERIQIRVFGQAQPFPKTHTAKIKRPGMDPILRPVDTDYRTRTNPHTGKVEKYDRGYKRKWMTLVTKTVDEYMFEHDLTPFPKNHPIAMGCLFFLTKAPRCKLIYPSQVPDEDNFLYAVRNALKRTPEKKGKPGRYPQGVLFYDDDQIVWHVGPEGKVWATNNNPPGVLITVQDALQIRAEIAEWQPDTQKEMELCP